MSAWASQLRSYRAEPNANQGNEGGSKTSGRKGAIMSDSRSRERGSTKDGKDLDRCVQLLSKILDTDAGSLGQPVKSSKVTKTKVASKKKSLKVHAKGKLTTKKTKVSKPHAEKSSKSSNQRFQQILQEIELSKTKDSSNARVNLGYEVPERDTDTLQRGHDNIHSSRPEQELSKNSAIRFDTSKHPLPPFKVPGQAVSAVPFNQRLSTSTPTMMMRAEDDAELSDTLATKPKHTTVSPWRYIPGSYSGSIASGEGYHLTAAGNNPLNSTDQCKVVEPPKVSEPLPRLTEGNVEFEPSPLKDYMSDVVQTSSMPSRELNEFIPPANYSLNTPTEGNSITGQKSLETETNVPKFIHRSNGVQQSVNVSDRHQIEIPQRDTTTVNKGHAPMPQESSTSVLQSFQSDHQSTGGKIPQKSNRNYRTESAERPLTTEIKVHIPTGQTLTEDRTVDLSGSSMHRKEVQFQDYTPEKTTRKPAVKETEERYKSAVSSTSIGVQAHTTCSTFHKQQDTQTSTTENPHDEPTTDSHTHGGNSREKAEEGKPKQTKKLQALHHLLKELKAAASDDQEVCRLANEIEATSTSMVWGKKVNRQLEIDLVMQPLRSENAQLRRQLRITNQQLKDKDQEVTNAQKPDPNFQVVHLEMVRHQLEKSLKEERLSKDRLRERTSHLESELEKVTEEKQRLFEVINNKDTEHIESSQDLVNEKHRLQAEVDRLKQQIRDTQGQVDRTKRENQLLSVTVKQKDQEIAKLQELVGSLQLSMTRLLHDLQTSGPEPFLLQRNGLQSKESYQMDDVLDRKTGSKEQTNGLPEHTQSHEYSKPLGSDNKVTTNLPSVVEPTKPGDKNSTAQFPVSPARRELNFDKKEETTIKTKTQTLDINHLRNSVRTGDIVLSPTSESFGLDMTLSEYDLPPGASPLGPKGSSSQRGGQSKGHPESLTVKELLTPLADRMQNQFQRLSTGGSQGNTGDQKGRAVERPSVVVESDDLSGFSSIESDHGEGDSTLIAEEEKQLIEAKVQEALEDEERSRFSITDYFQKYSSKDAQQVLNSIVETKISHSVEEDLLEEERDESDSVLAHFKPKEASSSTSSPKDQSSSRAPHSTVSFRSKPSLQDSIYKGTDLDTSISTIPYDDNKSMSSMSSTDSVSSVDDHAFKQGLAALDANISRMQHQLRIANF